PNTASYSAANGQNAAKASGGSCKSPSSINAHFPEQTRRPARIAASCPILRVNRHNRMGNRPVSFSAKFALPSGQASSTNTSSKERRTDRAASLARTQSDSKNALVRYIVTTKLSCGGSSDATACHPFGTSLWPWFLPSSTTAPQL